MIVKIVIRLLVVCCIGLTSPAFSQVDTARASKLYIRFSPQHLFINGFHLDVEKPLATGNRALVISPRLYSGPTRTVDALAGRRYAVRNDNNRVNGFGLEVLQRHYLTGRAGFNEKRFYLAFGPNFHWFNVTFNKEGFQEELGSDGLVYYRGGRREFYQKITRWGAVGMLGLQQPMATDRLLIDLYLGPGYKYSSSRTNYTTERFTERTSDFGYFGFYLLAGFKVGAAF